MKIVKRCLMAAAVLIFVCVAAAVIFIATFDVNRYKPLIVSRAKAALNRDVDFGKAALAFSWKEGVSVRVSDVVVSDDPVFQKGDFCAVKDVSLGVDVLGYLLHKKVDISGIFVHSPRVSIIREKDGRLNVMGLVKPAAEEEKDAAVSGSAAVARPFSAPAALPAVLISSLKVDGGTIMYEDRSFDPAMKVEVTDITASVDDMSLTQSFPFAVEGTVLGVPKNIKIKGRAQIDLTTNAVTLSELKASTDLSELLVEEIPAAFPMVKGAVLPVSLKGKADVMVDRLTASSQGLTALMAHVALADGEAHFKELASPLKGIQAHAQMTLSKIFVDSASAVIGQGSLKAAGVIEDYLAGQDYDVTLDAEGLKIQDVIAQEGAAVKAEGTFFGRLKAKGTGFSPQAVSSTLTGEGEVSGQAIKLKGINVLRAVLDKIAVIPGLSEKVQAGLSEKYKQKLAQADTVLSDIRLPLTIENGRVLIKDTLISADEFVFKGQTQAGLDGSFSAQGSFLIPKELSAAMGTAVPQLQYLLNPNQEIYVPLKVSGKAPEMQFVVDAGYIAQKLLANQAQTQLLEVIEKAIGAPKKETTATGAEGAGAPAAEGQGAQASSGLPQGTAAEEVVRNVLGSIFNK